MSTSTNNEGKVRFLDFFRKLTFDVTGFAPAQSLERFSNINVILGADSQKVAAVMDVVDYATQGPFESGVFTPDDLGRAQATVKAYFQNSSDFETTFKKKIAWFNRNYRRQFYPDILETLELGGFQLRKGHKVYHPQDFNNRGKRTLASFIGEPQTFVTSEYKSFSVELVERYLDFFRFLRLPLNAENVSQAISTPYDVDRFDGENTYWGRETVCGFEFATAPKPELLETLARLVAETGRVVFLGASGDAQNVVRDFFADRKNVTFFEIVPSDAALATIRISASSQS